MEEEEVFLFLDLGTDLLNVELMFLEELNLDLDEEVLDG
jgi:hypothetical protein